MLYYQNYEIPEKDYLSSIHNECRQLSPELYRCVMRQMQKNLERRGKV